jgi:outer membrane protein OmpA-like peptidoglycan-associated protein
MWEPRDSTDKPIYLSGTVPIDSADVKKAIFDLFRIDIKGYPDKLEVYARVFDSTGKFITNMGDPYKKFPDVRYFTSIREKLGKFYKIQDRNIPEFTVREYGAKDSIPYNIVLSVDYSGSMDPVMKAIFKGTEIFVKMKFPYDKIALTSFNRKFDLKVPLSKDTATILNQYRKVKYRNYGMFSAPYDALANCMDILETTEKGVPRVLVLFSDGDDNYSKDKVGDLIQRAKALNVNIFTIAFGYSKDENLKDIANYTGGKFYKAYSEKELISIFRDIYMSLRFYYLITYKAPTYWGWHHVFAGLNLPGRKDSLIAEGEYDTSDLFKELGNEFEMPILFDFDSSTVKPQSFTILDQIADQMMARPKLRLEIQGHTDNKGKVEYNQVLSEKRAKAVYDALISRGIEERRLRYRGFGLSRPRTSNETEEGRANNRRTMFVILAK